MKTIRFIMYDAWYLTIYVITGTINLLRYGLYTLSAWMIGNNFIKLVNCIVSKNFKDEFENSVLNLILFSSLIVVNYLFGKYNYLPYEKAKKWLGFSGVFDEEKVITTDTKKVEKKILLEMKTKMKKKIIDKEKRVISETILSSDELNSFTKKGSINPDKDLAALIGLDEVKLQIKILCSKMKFNKEMNIKENGKNHIALIGSSGTGKTVTAGILTGYLYKYGYIKSNTYISLSSTQLLGSFLGQTKDRTFKIVHQASKIGGVLFIDEIYALSNSQYANEAIAVLLKAVEEENFTLIIAGYEAETDMFLSQNQGLRSRFSTFINFKDYDAETSVKILEMYLSKYKLKISADVKEYYKKYVNELIQISNFNLENNISGYLHGNARQVQKDCNLLYGCHCVNYDNNILSNDEKMVITMKDIRQLEKNLTLIRRG